MRRIKVQSISDIITNSSSEVFLCNSKPYLCGSDSWADKVTRDFLKNNPDRSFVCEYLEDDYEDLEDLLWEISDFKTQEERDKFLDMIIESHPKLKVLIDNYWLVLVGDHDFENFDHDLDNAKDCAVSRFGRY